MAGTTVKNTIRFETGRQSRKELRIGTAPPAVPNRVPRVAKLMALAIRFEKLVHDGDVADYAELARLGHVTRARMTQFMNLLALAPDIQEAILFSPPVESRKDSITERELRHVVAEVNWAKQQDLWQAVSLS